MKRPIIFLSLLMSVIVVLSLVRIGLSNFLATDGIALSNMQTQISSLEKENMVLEQQLYEDQSLTHIASVAASEGFVEEKSQIVLSNTTPLAIRQ